MSVKTVPGTVTEVLIDENRTRNALSTGVMNELTAAVESFANSDDTRVLVVAGAGGVFSSGGNLKEDVPVAAVIEATTRLYAAIRNSPKPVVARVEGVCLGLAVGVAAACDFVITTADTRFALPEVRMGQAATMAAVTIVPRLRSADAHRLLMLGGDFDGNEAQAMGLVDASVPLADLADEQQRWVNQLLLGGPNALTVCKRLAQELPALDREAALSWASELTVELANSPEAREGSRAFTERRPPEWAAAGNEEPK